MTTCETFGILAVIFGFSAVYEVAINGADMKVLAVIAILAVMVLLVNVLAKLLTWYQKQAEKQKAGSWRQPTNRHCIY